MVTWPRVKYLMVAGLCAVAHNAIVIGGAYLGVHYVITTALGFCASLLLGYTLHVNFTFLEQASAASFARYTVAMAANFPLSVGLLFLLHDLMHIPVPAASPIATVLLFIWNYAASRWAILSRAAPASADKGKP